MGLMKPGKTDTDQGNLRRINLISSQAKQIEAVLGDIAEREGAQDPFQGGYTPKVEVVGRAFVLWTALGYRSKILRIPTYMCLVDMTAFFDTILPAVVVAQLFAEGVNIQILRYIRLLYENVHVCIRTAAGVSRFQHMWPGFRQGGRFSTTAGKTTIRRLMNKLRDALSPVFWGY